MARPRLLVLVPVHQAAVEHAPLVLFLLVAAVAAVLVSLCTGSRNARPWKQRRSSSLAPAPQDQDTGTGAGGAGRKQLLASLSGIGGKAAAVAKMVSWNRRSPPRSSSNDDEEDQLGGAAAVGGAEDEEALWKKTIIMGDKCRPLQFSGHIAFDADGNPLPPEPEAADDKDVAAAAAAEA
ncbi:hypothetical protein U9M48_020504 [Paspalum notatum var. saurae]|uniref:Uncharacterized protein n=1 Tax=Paspalum notatum var. saurae TaxID=547442 RepID=A0AAQ3TGZ4_PASNO